MFFFELNEADLYAIDGGLDPATVQLLKETGKLALRMGKVGLVVLAAGVVIGFGYEMICGE